MPTLDSLLRKAKKKDKEFLQETEVPLVTVSGTYREDLKGMHDLPEDDLKKDLVFSRAHFSMTIGAAVGAWKKTIDPQKAWILDPTNYVSGNSWTSVVLTEKIGLLVARFSLLKTLKNIVDKFGRQKMPILASITPPLLKMTRDIPGPILSFHIAAGNILLEKGKTVVQVITDPHVREEYLANSEKSTAFYCVFDEATKEEFLEKAHKLGKKVNEKRVIVAGPPVDPRVLATAEHKQAWSSHSGRPLRICITTGGLGTNKPEIKAILEQLLPETVGPNPKFQVMLYAGTHADIKDMGISLAQHCDVPFQTLYAYDPAKFEIGATLDLDPRPTVEITQPFSVIYHPQIIDANELLIHNGFPWADGFISKPSGDMAYDAVASGAFLLTLKEWGEWENNIRAKFLAHGVAKVAEVDAILSQLTRLMRANGKDAWITQAMHKTKTIDEKEDLYFRQGIKNILKAFRDVREK